MTRKYVFGLFLGGSILVSGFMDAAVAQTVPMFMQDVQMILPGSPAIADGSTKVTYQFIFLDKSGSPILGLKGKAVLGKLQAPIIEQGNGLYSTSIVPTKKVVSGTEKLSVYARNSAKQKISKSFTVSLNAVQTKTFEISSSPNQITLPQNNNVTINISQTSGISAEKLLITSSAGKVEKVESLGNGKFSAKYTPPQEKLYPHVALFSVADEQHPENNSVYVLQQNGKTNYPINTLPESTATIDIGGQEFGPVQINASGKGNILIEVPPGYKNASLITMNNQRRTEEPIDLKVPLNVQGVNFFPIVKEIPADGKTEYNLRLFATTVTGKPDTNADLRVKSSKGTFGSIKNNGKGFYSVSYTPPYSNTKDSVQFQAFLQSDTGVNNDTISIELLPSLPEQVELVSEVGKLLKNAKTFNVLTSLKSIEKKGMSKRDISFAASGAELVSTKELGTGDYITKFSTTTTGQVDVAAFVSGSVSQNLPHSIMMVPSRGRVLNDGVSKTVLSFVVVDQFGYPLSDQTVSLNIVAGSGTLASEVKTNSAGVGFVTYTAGRDIGVVKIRASSADLYNTFAILQLPETLIPSLERLPRSGTVEQVELENKVAESVHTIQIKRKG